MEPLKKTYNPGSLKTPIKADSMNAFLKMNYLPITVIQSVSLSAREAEIPQPRPESVPLIFPALPVLFLQPP